MFAADRIANDPANAQRQLIAEYKVDRGSILAADGTTVLASSRKSPGALRFQRRYPHARAVRARDRLLLVRVRTHGARAELQRLPDRRRRRAPAADAHRPDPRPAQAGRDDRDDPRARDPGGRGGGGGGGGRRRRDRRDRPRDRRRARPGLRAELRPEPARLAGPEGRPRRVGRAERRSREAAALARERRAVPARLDVQARDGVGGARERVRPGEPVAQPERARPPAHRRDDRRTSAARRARAARRSRSPTRSVSRATSCSARSGSSSAPRSSPSRRAQYGFTAEAGEDLVPFDIPWSSGVFPAPETFEGRDPAVAISAIGQQDVAANPLQMALVGAAIANGGVEMQPRLVTEARDPSGRVIAEFDPKEFSRPLSPENAAALTQMMVGVVAERDRHRGPDPRRRRSRARRAPPSTARARTRTRGSCGSRPPKLPQVAVAVIVLDGGSLGQRGDGRPGRRADREGGARGRPGRVEQTDGRTGGSEDRSAGDPRGPLPRRARARPRRHGQGLPRHRHGARPDRGGEDPRAAVRRRRRLRAAIPSRGAGRGEHRATRTSSRSSTPARTTACTTS